MPARLSELARGPVRKVEPRGAGRASRSPPERAGPRGCRCSSAWGRGEPSDPRKRPPGPPPGAGWGEDSRGAGCSRLLVVLGGSRRRLAHSVAGEGLRSRRGRGGAAARGGGDYSQPGPRPRPHTWAARHSGAGSAGAGRLAPAKAWPRPLLPPWGGLLARQVLTAVGCQVSASFPPSAHPLSPGMQTLLPRRVSKFFLPREMGGKPR